MNRIVTTHNLEINITYSCNLGCEYCTHLGKYLQGIVAVDEIVHSFETWNRKIRPESIILIGGEPLLHPELENIVRETQRCWCDSQIQLVTNGLLLRQISSETLTALRECNVFVTVSKHFDSPEYNERLAPEISLLESQAIRHEIRYSAAGWFKSYRKEGDTIRLYETDPEEAWQCCFVKNNCTTLLENRIYKCPQLALFRYAYQHGFVPNDWERLLDGQPLTPEASPEEIERFLHEGAVPLCSICPKSFEYVESTEKHPDILKKIGGTHVIR